MIILITGIEKSGKSAIAEAWARDLADKKDFNLIYLATTRPDSDQELRIINKSRKRRQSTRFKTIECYGIISGCLETLSPQDKSKSIILLECVNSMVKNRLFPDNSAVAKNSDIVVHEVTEDIRALCTQVPDIILVSASGQAPADADYNTKLLYDTVNQVNAILFRNADERYEMRCGKPVQIL